MQLPMIMELLQLPLEQPPKKLQGLKPSAGRFRAINLGYENAKSAFLGFLMIFDFCSFAGILKRLNSHGESLFRCSRKMEFAWNKKNGRLYVHFWHVQRNSVYAHTLPQSRYPSHIPGPLEITCLHVATRSSKRPCEHWQGFERSPPSVSQNTPWPNNRRPVLHQSSVDPTISFAWDTLQIVCFVFQIDPTP